MRVAAYARYSSDSQREASIEDQLRNVRAYCAREGWPAPEAYTDAAISGSRTDRPAYQRLLADAAQWDVILVDDLSRLARDSIEIGQAVRRLTFAGVRLIGVSDGVDTGRKSHKADVGLRGLIGEIYLDDLRDKTHRGLTGRALAGASAGGLPYGYRVTERGQREIHADQADIVRRIYAEYLAGYSPREIAGRLNADAVPSPRGSTWAASAIHGDVRRGIGILANPIYVGRQTWNRSAWVKHPDTGRRVRRERPESEWITTAHPALAIVSADTWNAAQRRIRGQSRATGTAGRPPRYLLSGLLRCGECGGPLAIVDRYRYGCANAKNRGTCTSTLRFPRIDAERALLAGIKRDLLSPAAFADFQRAVQAELRRRQPDHDAAKRARAKALRERDNLLAAIRAGILTPSTRAELLRAESQLEHAERALSAPAPASMLPRLRERWDRIVHTLEHAATRSAECREILRTLIGTAKVRNDNGQPVAELADCQLAMVAGARCGQYLTPTLRIPLRPAVTTPADTPASVRTRARRA